MLSDPYCTIAVNIRAQEQLIRQDFIIIYEIHLIINHRSCTLFLISIFYFIILFQID